MKTFLISLLLLCLTSKIFPQNVYENYVPSDTSMGQRLSLYSFDLIGFEHTRYSNSFTTSIIGDYTKWKFTPKMLWAINSTLYNNYDYYKEYARSESHFQNELVIKGGVSYYLSPNKFYLTLGGNAIVYHLSGSKTSEVEETYSEQSGQGYLNGAIGFGRIFNSIGIEYGLYFSESLLKHKISKKRLSMKSLSQIASLIYKFRNGDLAYKYRDDAAVGLFKETEKIMIQNNDISAPLDIENGIRLYEILSNATGNYYIYPRYQGFQIQAQMQYQIFNDAKPHNHHANISGIYGIPLSEKDNLLFSGYFSLPVDTLATGSLGYTVYDPINNPNSNFYALYPDYNNLSFFKISPGTSFFDGQTASGNSSEYALNGNFTHSFNSFAGISIGASYYEHIPKYYDNAGTFSVGGKLDYNIYSSLRLQGVLIYNKNIKNANNQLSIHLGASYIIF